MLEPITNHLARHRHTIPGGARVTAAIALQTAQEYLQGAFPQLHGSMKPTQYTPAFLTIVVAHPAIAQELKNHHAPLLRVLAEHKTPTHTIRVRVGMLTEPSVEV